ncbi:putative DNA mismatch repair protein MutS, core domain superfamily [Helianthus annuus]|uniref:DNA mismatch repair protein MutS, core domain superfamily n=1 Tax=Helianthus annuus TaxID=4232 RepID=A0A251S0H5_HELAN|nr:endonuclease MutS2 isoform X1 [Helianthus annuus]KAF5760703.1 putative DNA mismatch repair protein MutS, core domain superfamily [Helianthus annuus]KAJ0438690.1 putative DNA mismatch repair protein MutS, core [Helianthus annuus]KAJ0645358.1 putative DNA mismatch repair protein MutS, core [Helianthus annuus]
MNLCNFVFFISPTKPSLTLTTRSFKCSSSPPTSHQLKLADSLQLQTLNILEWPSVCNQLSAFTSTTMGSSAARGGQVVIGRSPQESRRLLDQTSAAFALHLPPDFSGIEDVSEVVESAVSGQLLSIREICAVKRTLWSARALFEKLEKIGEQSERYYPLLEILQNCNFLTELEQKIDYCIDSKFLVILDRASEDLEIIRLERKSNMDDLDTLLKGISTKIYQAGGIDKPLVTKRRSRMCVGVKASHKSLLPNGVVLDVSSSGATYFTEPRDAVDLNNMEVRLSNAERAEEQAILGLLASEIAQSGSDIKYLLDKVLEVDLAIARAAHARWMNGKCPVISSGGFENDGLSINIEGIQHPLLLETSLGSLTGHATSKSGNSIMWCEENGVMGQSLTFPVPIDIKVEHETRVVVISGPNTGGKTASMKTLGVASIMLKAGMFLPARNHPTLPWFDFILADIGDSQSLEQSLSTFSGHLSRICKMLEVTTKQSLILIDEIGSGTDPSEGVALSTSILEYLKDKVNLAVITTHYADLSLLKKKDSQYENAAMEFSLQTLQPTYRILWGSTGESNALNIAKSIGFDEKVVARAETWVKRLMPDKAEKRRGLLYQSLMEEKNRLEVQANRAERIYSNVMDLYNEIKEEANDLPKRETALKAKEAQKTRKEIITMKSQLETIVKEYEAKIATASIDQLNTLLKESESAISSIIEAHCYTEESSATDAEASSLSVKLGDQVIVRELGNKLATIVEPPGTDGTTLVQYGKIRVRANVSGMRGIQSSSDTAPTPNSQSQIKKQGQRIKSLKNLSEVKNSEEIVYGPAVQTSKNTVDLRGMRVEEASHNLNLALSTFRPGSVLFIIHGMGTGVVKESVLQILKKHPRVLKFEQESPTNYGCTVAYIK